MANHKTFFHGWRGRLRGGNFRGGLLKVYEKGRGMGSEGFGPLQPKSTSVTVAVTSLRQSFLFVVICEPFVDRLLSIVISRPDPCKSKSSFSQFETFYKLL